VVSYQLGSALIDNPLALLTGKSAGALPRALIAAFTASILLTTI